MGILTGEKKSQTYSKFGEFWQRAKGNCVLQSSRHASKIMLPNARYCISKKEPKLEKQVELPSFTQVLDIQSCDPSCDG